MTNSTDPPTTPEWPEELEAGIKHVLELGITGAIQRLDEDQAYAEAHPHPAIAPFDTGLYEIRLDPTDFTTFEWNFVVRHWMSRADRMQYSVFCDEDKAAGLRRLVEIGLLQARELYPESGVGYGELARPLGLASHLTVRGWLTPQMHGSAGEAWFDVDDLRLFAGDLRMVTIHDNLLWRLWAAADELPFYRAFGLDDSAVKPVDQVTWSDTWAAVVMPPANTAASRHAALRPLTSVEVAASRDELEQRHPNVAMQPFRLSAEEGIAARERRREQVTGAQRRA